MNERASEWEKGSNAPMTEELGGELSASMTSTSPATTDAPITGGRVDAAAAVQGSGGGLPGIDASNEPDLNVGGAMATPPGAGVADQPTGAGEIDPEARAGVLGGPDPTRTGAVTGGGLGSDLGGSIDSSAEAAARGEGDTGGAR